jgi:mitogen-activated protein kinase kinase 1
VSCEYVVDETCRLRRLTLKLCLAQKTVATRIACRKMAPKRPPGLQVEVPQPDERMKITDTMTLIVADSQGRELKVKERGMLKTPEPDRPEGPQNDAVFNKIHFEDLRIGEVVGAGSQGRVRKVQHRITGEILALKSLAFTEDKDATRQAVHHELVRIEALKHENVVSSYEAYFREGKIYILMEFMDAGTMVSVLKRRDNRGFPENRLAMAAKHMLLGLAHLHNSNVVHRDIKPANILANSKGLAKISDFGVASSGESKVHMTSVGSTPYMSPERVRSLPYSTLCDIWSVGLSLAELAIGTYPLGNVKGKIFELCQMIASGHVNVKWELAGERVFSAELQDFVARCLSPVECRPSAHQLLEHPFIAMAGSLALPQMGEWYMNPTD